MFHRVLLEARKNIRGTITTVRGKDEEMSKTTIAEAQQPYENKMAKGRYRPSNG